MTSGPRTDQEELGDIAEATESAHAAYPASSPFRAAARRPALTRISPVAGAIPDYRPRTGLHDLTAAMTVAAVAVPAAMGYAEVAGLSPVHGLYALLIPTVAYALLGSSRQLAVGPDGSISALVGAVVVANAAAGSADAAQIAALLALLVAGCFAIGRVARLGWIADYLSRPVLVGYIHGVAAVLVIGQLGKLLGLDVHAADPLRELYEIARALPSTSLATLAVGGGALLVLVALRLRAPRVPGALLVVIGGIVLSSALALTAHGVAAVGSLPSGLPSLGLPSSSTSLVTLVPAALGLFLVTFADGVLTARS